MNTKSVLIIEDEKRMAEELEGVFLDSKEYAFTVKIASSRKEAITALDSDKQYDVIVIDRQIDSECMELFVLRAITYSCPHSVAIVWTAHFDQDSPLPEELENLKECFRMGVWDYFPKNIAGELDPDTFEKVVQSATRRLKQLDAVRPAQDRMKQLYAEAVEKHPGQWIAVQEENIVASADSYLLLAVKLDQQERISKDALVDWFEPVVFKIPRRPEYSEMT